MTLRSEMSSFYNSFISAENNTLGFLANPESVIENYDSFLANVSIPFASNLLTQRAPKNGSYVEGFVSITVFSLLATRRDLSMRKMTRQDYYNMASTELQSEVERLDRAKIDVIQSIAGNTQAAGRG